MNTTFYFNQHINKIIIFSVVFFILHWFLFHFIFQINVPYGFDYFAIDVAYDFHKTGVLPVHELITPYSSHILLFPYLIMLPNLVLNSFDVVNMYYLQLLPFTGTLFISYLLVKKTNSKILYTIIPIAAIIFSPLITSSQHVFPIWQFIIPQLSIISVIFLFNKKSINSKIFIFAISLGIISTFSSTFGIVIWIAGIFGLINFNFTIKKFIGKKWLVLWITCMILCGIIYYGSFNQEQLPQIGKTSPLSLEGLSFITVFLSTAFRLKFDLLLNLVGIFSIILSIICAVYFIKIKKFESVKPWFNFIIVGISSAVVAQLGRGHLDLHGGNETYYIHFSQFFQIGLLVLLVMMIFNLKLNSKSNRTKLIIKILILIIISQSLLLIPSYYAAWERGEHYFDWKEIFMNCFSLNPNPNCDEDYGKPLSLETGLNHRMFYYFFENKYSFFSDNSFQKYNSEVIQNNTKILSENSKSEIGIGKIEKINNFSLLENVYYIDISSPIKISGWFVDKNLNELDNVYLLVNDEPLIKFNKSELVNYQYENSDKVLFDVHEWSISFFSGYLKHDCSKINIVALKDNIKINFNEEIKLCKNDSFE